MKSPLHILHLEDNPIDAGLIEATLESAGVVCTITRVQSRGEFVAALERGGVDLVLSDFSLPGFDGFAAAEIIRTRWPEIPLILVSGTMGEEFAIDSLKGGATDYVLKERPVRLVPAVRRAMLEVEARKERERLEAQFVEAQKVEVIGQLASGIAHDFNNILGVIIGYSDLMMQQLGDDHPLHKYSREIQHAAERAAALTRQLLVFGRKQKVQLSVLDLNQVVADMDKMLRRLIDENVGLSIVLGQEIGRIKADSNQIGQVLMNLVVNARDAMPGGGRLTISTGNVTLGKIPGTAARPEMAPGDYVMLAVSDTGVGMTEEVKARLFEAFFTTKAAGKGTGLGLATCQTIVRQCAGQIQVESEEGRGTTFKIYFPRVDQPLDISTDFLKRKPAGPLPRGTETLLLVEDEPSVRHLACSVLETQGYTVIRANNGQDGLHAARENKGAPISLVITDVIMPQMDGKVMSEWLKVTYPGLKILFTSGYTDEVIAHHGVLEPGVAFLPKPYTPAALTRKVRELLDAK